MKKILLMLLLLVFVYGCTGGGVSDQYRKGTQGITLSFVESAPPNKVFDTDPFIIGVEARNMGAESTNVNFKLSGYDPSIVGMSGAGSIRLGGKEEVYNPQEGEGNVVTFQRSSTNLGDADTYTPTFMVTACYSYTTVAQAQVCINGNPSFNKGVCTVGAVSLSGGQGGPVGVTTVEVAATPGKTNFKIHIKNFGSGGPCVGGQVEELERVSVNSVKVHNRALGCKPLDGNSLRLINGAGTLYCEMGVGLDEVYPTPLTVTLSYDYSTSIQKSVQIIKAPR